MIDKRRPGLKPWCVLAVLVVPIAAAGCGQGSNPYASDHAIANATIAGQLALELELAAYNSGEEAGIDSRCASNDTSRYECTVYRAADATTALMARYRVTPCLEGGWRARRTGGSTWFPASARRDTAESGPICR